MKIIPSRFVSLIVLALMASAVGVRAQTVFLTFSGGGGTPLVISWTTPITYTITATPFNGGKDPYFVFNEVGNVFSGVQHPLTGGGAPTYTGVDGTFTINNISSGENFNDITTNDIKFRNTPESGTTLLYTGESFTLSAGTMTTTSLYFGTLPTNGVYSTFITDASYHFMGNGSLSAVPEPSTYAMVAGSATLAFAGWKRRRSLRPGVEA